MSTLVNPLMPISPSYPKYGITEKKKAELDALTIQVLEAQQEVDQFQAVVTALTAKSEKFEGFFADAKSKQAQALSDKNLVDQVVQNALELQQNSSIAKKSMKNADDRMNTLADLLSSVMNQLIYTGEVLNKLANTTAQMKKQNPLISDELISRISDAGKDTNTSVALALVAIQSTFAAQASSGEAYASTFVQSSKASSLFNLLNNNDSKTTSIQKLLKQAYNDAQSNYVKAKRAAEEATNELSVMQIKLNKAQAKLESLQAGLAAANAAAYAS